VEREKSGVREAADQVTDNCYNCGKQANHTKQLYSKPGKSTIDGPVATLKLAANFIGNLGPEGDLCGRICSAVSGVLVLTSLSSWLPSSLLRGCVTLVYRKGVLVFV